MEYICTKCGYVGPRGTEHQGCDYHAALVHSEAEYRDLLQSHHSLCGKIEVLKDELGKKELQVSEMIELLRQASELYTGYGLICGPVNGYPEYDGNINPGAWIGKVRAIVRASEKRKAEG
jgi:hypothetical protein